jgi:hypothetical protein
MNLHKPGEAMQKIPTLFVRDPDNRAYVLPGVTPGCEWVLAGEGVATRKLDGTCVMFDGAAWWARREVKPGKTPPPDYQPVSTDKVTGKTVGWEPIARSAFAKFHAEAVEVAQAAEHPGGVPPESWPVGTYELIGPKINGNPERREVHELVAHSDADVLYIPDRSFEGLRQVVTDLAKVAHCEGLVFHHPDGRMVKIKARDFPEEAAL